MDPLGVMGSFVETGNVMDMVQLYFLFICFIVLLLLGNKGIKRIRWKRKLTRYVTVTVAKKDYSCCYHGNNSELSSKEPYCKIECRLYFFLDGMSRYIIVEQAVFKKYKIGSKLTLRIIDGIAKEEELKQTEFLLL